MHYWYAHVPHHIFLYLSENQKKKKIARNVNRKKDERISRVILAANVWDKLSRKNINNGNAITAADCAVPNPPTQNVIELTVPMSKCRQFGTGRDRLYIFLPPLFCFIES